MAAVLAVLGVAVVVLLVITLRLARRGRAVASNEKAHAWPPAIPPPTANIAVVTLYELWTRRVEREKLGAQDAAGADLGDLLAEVLYAAGGVEREFRELRKALDEAQPHDAQQLASPEPPRPAVSPQVQPAPPPQERPTARALVAARPQREASYSFVNLLSWVRSTVERTDRPVKPGSLERDGLLPALQPGELHDRVEAAVQHLRTALKDSRSLSSHAFHAAAVPSEAQEPAEDRDLLAYATGLMAATEEFVERVLNAFAASR